MSFVTWTTSHFKQDEKTRVDAALEAEHVAEAAWRAVCKAVDERDKHQCRACGKRCDVNATGLLKRAHRHHIVYLSAGGLDVTSNLATVCSSCHNDEHRHRISIEGNADIALTVYRLPQHDGDTGYVIRQEIAPHVLVPRD